MRSAPTLGRMSLPLPTGPASPLAFFSLLVADDEHLPLLEAAIALGQDADPGLDLAQVLDQVDLLVKRLKSRLPADAGAVQRLRILNHFFFSVLGFAGNVNNYFDPANSYLHQVLSTRRGIPISLAVLYVELGRQIGLRARGVSFPGHFLVKVSLSDGEVVIDPFTGQALSREQLEERMEPYRPGRGGGAELDAPLGQFLAAASGREILARMLGNLKSIWHARGDLLQELAVQERLVRLLPQAWEERRDRGLLLADLGRASEARADLQAYLQAVPKAPDVVEIALALGRLAADTAGPAG